MKFIEKNEIFDGFNISVFVIACLAILAISGCGKEMLDVTCHENTVHLALKPGENADFVKAVTELTCSQLENK